MFASPLVARQAQATPDLTPVSGTGPRRGYARPRHAHRGARPRLELLPPARRRRAPRRHLRGGRREKEMLRLGDEVTRERPHLAARPPTAPSQRCGACKQLADALGRDRGDRQGDERDPHRRERQRARRPDRGRDRRRGRGHQRARGGPADLRGGARERRDRSGARARASTSAAAASR